MAHRGPQAPVSFVDKPVLSTVDSFMRRGARRVVVCVGYVSERGLTRLADWLDLMAADGEILLLVGMAPRNWTFLAQSAEAHATYILRAMQTKAAELDRALQRLARLQKAGRLQVRLRHPRSPVHAKLYLIQSGPNAWKGLAGSSNLSESGLTQPGEYNLVLDADAAAQSERWMNRQWNAPSSQQADGLWRALLDMAAPAPDAGHRDRSVVRSHPTGHRRARPAATGSGKGRSSKRAASRRTRRSGCWKPVLGLPLAGGLLLFLWSLAG